jgi:two-component system sensor histidine kinase PhoQ
MELNLSLRRRSVIIALVALIVFTPLAIFAIDKAYAASLKDATFKQLKLKSLMLITAFEIVDDQPSMPNTVFDEQLAIPGSGIIGAISWDKELVWQSGSSQGDKKLSLPQTTATGEEAFIETDENFTYTYTAEFETSSGYVPINFFIMYDQRGYIAARKVFLRTLWGWLSALNLILLLCLLFSLRFLLNPLTVLRGEISNTTSGQQGRIKNKYPKEITPLSASINQLLDNEEQQRTRYKNSLSDLAHSLKTPLTVALSESQSNPALTQPLQEIKAIINRQLKRAAASSTEWHQAFPVKPMVTKLKGAMEKVHADKRLAFLVEIDDDCEIAIEQTDLMECMGNLLDNACKVAKRTVLVNTTLKMNSLVISVEDDGPGVPHAQREELRSRGKRLDTYAEGQGIGLAVVSDIIASYGGTFTIEDSKLGGARMSLAFPHSPR